MKSVEINNLRFKIERPYFTEGILEGVELVNSKSECTANHKACIEIGLESEGCKILEHTAKTEITTQILDPDFKDRFVRNLCRTVYLKPNTNFDFQM